MIDLIKLRQEKLERTLIFFNSVDKLTSKYQYMRREIGQAIGELNPLLVMFTSSTDQSIKNNILADLNDPEGLVRAVLCTSALSVGINVSSVKCHSLFKLRSLFKKLEGLLASTTCAATLFCYCFQESLTQ